MSESAIDELRRLLDERGVEYRVSATGYSVEIGPYITAYANRSDTTLDVSLRQVTPEQAIAATLGSSNCTNSERTGTCQIEQTCHVQIAGFDVYHDDYECSECGGEMFEGFKFCPWCGRRVVDA